MPISPLGSSVRILTVDGNFTNSFDENNRPTDFKIDGEPVSREEYYTRLNLDNVIVISSEPPE